MRCSYDAAKRTKVLEERGLDLADAWKAFEGFHLTRADPAHSVDEERVKTLGMVGEDVILIIWAPRPSERRIITMWKVDDRERAKYHEQRTRSG